MRTVRALLALLLLVAAVARPQPAAAEDNPISIEELTAWVPRDGDYAVKLKVPSGTGGQILVSIYEPLVTTDEVDITASGRGLGRREYRLPTQEWAAGTTSVVVRVPISSVDGRDGRLRLDAAVYSVVLDIEPDEGTAKRFVTHLRHLDGPLPTTPVSVIIAIDAALGVDGTGRLRAIEVASQAKLAGDLANVANHPQALVTLALSGAAVSDLPAETAATVARLASASPVLNQPFAPLDPQAWLNKGLAGPLAEQFDQGERQLERASLQPVLKSVWAASPTAALSVLQWLSARGVRRFVLPEDTADSPPSVLQIKGLPATHVALRAANTATNSAESGALAADRILSRLAIGALAGIDRETPIVVALRPELTADRKLTAALLDGLSTAGVFRPVPLADAFALAETAGSTAKAVELTAESPPDVTAVATDVIRETTRLTSYSGALGAEQPSLLAPKRAVLALGSADLDQGTRSRLAATITQNVTDGLSGVDVPTNAPITITSHEATIPLTIRNRSDHPLTVLVSIRSNELTIRSDNPQLFVLEAGRTQDLEVSVRVSRSGDFPLDVLVTTPDGLLTVAGPTTVTLRSTAVSGLGLIISIGALGFLLLWWLSHRRAGRRQAQQVDRVTDPESDAIAESESESDSSAVKEIQRS